jgi:hypothetical protein
VRAPVRPADHHLLAGGDHVLEGDAQVGEGGEEPGQAAIEALEAGRLAREGLVVGDGGGQEVVGRVEVPLVEDLLVERAD